MPYAMVLLLLFMDATAQSANPLPSKPRTCALIRVIVSELGGACVDSASDENRACFEKNVLFFRVCAFKSRSFEEPEVWRLFADLPAVYTVSSYEERGLTPPTPAIRRFQTVMHPIPLRFGVAL